MKRLIVNADDFGLTGGVNRAIAELHRLGALTATTLMAKSKATQEAVDLAGRTPTLGVGCHVVLVDGTPVLPASEIPTLVDGATGRFRPTLGGFVADLFLKRIRLEEIEAEAEAQLARLRGMGVSMTHVDTHKHTHIFPQVLAPLLAAASRQKIHAIRNPFEPQWSTGVTSGAPVGRRLQVSALNGFREGFLRRVAQSKMATTAGAVGVLATGTLDSFVLQSLLKAMPEGDWELVTHPGYNDADLEAAGTRLRSSRDLERRALAEARFPAGMALIHFGDLGS